jgi:hypothetical protein
MNHQLGGFMSEKRSREFIWLPSVEERLRKRYEKLVNVWW